MQPRAESSIDSGLGAGAGTADAIAASRMRGVRNFMDICLI